MLEQSDKDKGDNYNGISFFCPGCKEDHVVKIGEGGWQFSGDRDNPTLSPSILVRSGHYASHYKTGDNCWCSYNAEQIAKGEPQSGYKCSVCHSFIKDGKIQFLGDCTHELAGQTVNLPDWDDGMEVTMCNGLRILGMAGRGR
jgi:hypothetical protein